MITSLDQLDFDKKYTYADYLLWRFQERVELLKGKLFKMAAPNVMHQLISSRLHITLGNYFMKKNCNVFSAPFDVRLPLPKNKTEKGKIDTIVQPDLCVICDNSILDKQGANGAPDLVVEILSPGNSKKEMSSKFELYQEAGVKEYWIVDPVHRTVLLYGLIEGKFVSNTIPFSDEDTLSSHLFPDLQIDLREIFPAEEQDN